MLGISAQQLHKYEIGQNRITAARLYACAQALDVPVSSFYIGLQRMGSTYEPVVPPATNFPNRPMRMREIEHLSRIIVDIDDPGLRRKLVELIEAFAARLGQSRGSP